MNVKQMINNQQGIYNLLKQSKQNDRLSHAYLFYGAEGVGKKEMAYALACLEYCPNGGCLECEVCRTILEDKHLNVNYIGILENKKLISKEQITDLQEEFSKTSLIDGVRVYIVDGIDTASASAQNSLLKFIEEPVNNTPTIGIFIATELANVVSTIVSRCSLVRFPSLDVRVLIELLQEEGADALNSSLASLITNNVDSGLELIEGDDFQIAKALFLEFLDIQTPENAIIFHIKNGKNMSVAVIRLFFKWLIAFFEDLMQIENKEKLILQGLYDKMNIYAKKENKVLREQYAYILELYSRLDYNISPVNLVYMLVNKLFL